MGVLNRTIDNAPTKPNETIHLIKIDQPSQVRLIQNIILNITTKIITQLSELGPNPTRLSFCRKIETHPDRDVPLYSGIYGISYIFRKRYHKMDRKYFKKTGIVTLCDNDSYAKGALVLARSLRNVGTKCDLICLITTSISENMKLELEIIFTKVIKCFNRFNST